MEPFLPKIGGIVPCTHQALSQDVPDSEARQWHTSMIDEHMRFLV
jgi:hypothetical protein